MTESTASYKVNQWLYTHPDATKIPYHIERLMIADVKHQQAARSKPADPTTERTKLKDELEEYLIDYATRKNAELVLADYIDSIVVGGDLGLDRIVSRMRSCRKHGSIGRASDGGHVHVWDEKCSCSKLCPHEARDETRRIIRRYMPAIETFIDADKKHRAHYGVFSYRNYKAGELAEGKKHIIKKFQDWKKQFKQVKGVLLVQEDPLSVHHDWNVHLNVILLTEGEFNYKTARSIWGNEYQLYFKPINKTGLVKTLCETIKYSAMIVPEKSERKSTTRTTKAPAMTEWPHDLWLEWYQANRKFRRTRSYGVLYRLKDQEADKDLEGVEWIGEIKFSDDGQYLVSLIQGDNFGRRYRRISDLFDDFSTSTDPPYD